MKLIASKKLALVNPNAQLDAASVRNAIVSGTGQLFHVAINNTDADAYIKRMTSQGYTCHVFEYVESLRTTTSIQTIKVA